MKNMIAGKSNLKPEDIVGHAEWKAIKIAAAVAAANTVAMRRVKILPKPFVLLNSKTIRVFTSN